MIVKILSVVGARPNFMKVAPLCAALRGIPGIEHCLVHSGQHYDGKLSGAFFRDLSLPEPDFNLEVGSGSHVWQTAETMKRLEPVMLEQSPDVVVVVGDVNSTLAAALTAVKLGIRLAHIEAGLRSFDIRMPEEINRKLTDVIADFLFVTEDSGVQNLQNEGIPSDRIFLVGNTMIDCLFTHRRLAARSRILRELKLEIDADRTLPYAVMTLHRPSNVDDPRILRSLLEVTATLAKELPIYFPIHPRSQERIKALSLDHFFTKPGTDSPRQGLFSLEPLGYLDFLRLMESARLVLTDSGGIQEETTVLGIPCLTLRENTERPITVDHGTNEIVGLDSERILEAARRVIRGDIRSGRRPPLWDGHAAVRIARILVEHLEPELLVKSENGHAR
jgi:UDP-N-acetylglucosamine 2-epimerase (non-hydrolysing)